MFSAIVFLLLTQMSSRTFGQYLVSCVHVNTKGSIYICYVFGDGNWAHGAIVMMWVFVLSVLKKCSVSSIFL